MKHALLSLCLLSAINASAKKNNCTVVFHIKNADSTYYSCFVDEEKILYLDTLPETTDSFSTYIEEPVGISMIIENDTARRLEFYIYEGRLEIDVDAANTHSSKFINSPLNEEYFDIRRKRDSIQGLVYTPEAIEKIRGSGIFSPVRDSIRKIFDKHMNELEKQQYQIGFNRTGSFHTLLFINFWLQNALLKDDDALFSKKELELLYDKLDKKLRRFPTYKKCREMFLQATGTNSKINPPLYKY